MFVITYTNNVPVIRHHVNQVHQSIDRNMAGRGMGGGICDSGTGIMLDIVSSNIVLCVLVCVCLKLEVIRAHMSTHIISRLPH